jgi:hypothetical protein
LPFFPPGHKFQTSILDSGDARDIHTKVRVYSKEKYALRTQLTESLRTAVPILSAFRHRFYWLFRRCTLAAADLPVLPQW